MKILDLHNVEKCVILFKIEKFITDNFDNLPVKIITGYSEYNISELTKVVLKYELNVIKDMWINGGAWVILNKGI